MAVLNSEKLIRIIQDMAPTINFETSTIAEAPIPEAIPSELTALASSAVTKSEQLLSFREIEPNFSELGFIEHSQILSSAVNSFLSRMETTRTEISKIEELIDLQLFENEVTEFAQSVEIESGIVPPSDRHEIGICHSETIIDLIAFFSGTLLGRFSLDRPGFVLANQGETLADYLALVPEPSFMPDDDNVVPFTEGQWFEDDVVARFYEFLKVAFGEEHFSENVRFIEETLGKDIRKYFLTDFYTEHVKRYKTRPIYWMFSSPQGSFNALIYMHRYNSSTVGTVLKYVQEFVHKLRSQKEVEDRIAVSATNARDQAQAAKESAKLQKMIVEVSGWERDVLYPLAQKQIELDLDDGVKANYPKFGKALKQIKGLDKNDE